MKILISYVLLHLFLLVVLIEEETNRIQDV